VVSRSCSRCAAAAATRRLSPPKLSAVTVVGSTSATSTPVIASTGVTQPCPVNQTTPSRLRRPTTGAEMSMVLTASRRSIGRTQLAKNRPYSPAARW
jgi:hypothetical protein